MIWTAAFWKGAGERALKTFIQTFTATQLAALTGALSAWDVAWATTVWSSLGVGLLAAVLSLLMSMGNADFTAGTPQGTPLTDVDYQVYENIVEQADPKDVPDGFENDSYDDEVAQEAVVKY